MRTFFRQFLRHSKGEWAGKPFELIAWQWERIIQPLYGWKRKDGSRRFRKAYIEVPKKNGKSTICSGLSLYGLVGDSEPGAEVYVAAADRDQASIVFNEAANMVDASPALKSRLEVVRSTKRVVFPQTRSVYKALSAEVATKEGLNIHTLIFDELHAQKTRELWDTLTYGGAARRQPLLISITTAGFDRESICWEQHEYARRILDGSIVDPSFFAFISAADEEDDWTSPDTWRKANPSFGITINEDDFAEACREAQNSPAKENSFRRYRLNQWTDSDVRAISSEQWRDCKAEYTEDDLAKLPCVGGLDLSSTQDITALVWVFVVDGKYRLLPRLWVPEEACRDRERRNKTLVDRWVKSGHMIQTPGNSVDYEFIRKQINDDARKFDVREVAFDPWNARQLATQLWEQDGINVVEFRQGFASMAEPTKLLLGLLADRKIEHPDNPCLNWMAGNFTVEEDAQGNLKPSKKKSTEKIDGIVATVMGIGRGAYSLGGSVYESRGLTVLGA